MKRLEKLPEITERGLGGLTAGDELKQRILEAAAQPTQVKITPIRKVQWQRWAGGIAAAVVLAVGIGTGIPSVLRQNQPNVPVEQEAADVEEDASPIMLAMAYQEAPEEAIQDGADEAADFGRMKRAAVASTSGEDKILLITRSAGSNAKSREGKLTADLGKGTIQLANQKSAAGYPSIWEENEGTVFPMIRVNDRYYRMLSEPAEVSKSLLGDSLGKVNAFTAEPSLADSASVASNAAENGNTVYEVKGMGTTLVAAKVNGQLRAFQRVSFSGAALRGEEKLADTLGIAGHIVAMELSGKGTVNDPHTCEELFAKLIAQAKYESSGSVSASQSLLVKLDNNLVIQLAVKGNRFAACGVWSCPGFFQAFAEAVK